MIVREIDFMSFSNTIRYIIRVILVGNLILEIFQMLQVNYYSPCATDSFNKRDLKANTKSKKFLDSKDITKEEK